MNTLPSPPVIDDTIQSWADVDAGVPERFTIITGITWIDGAILPIVWDEKERKEYMEADGLAWNGPHGSSCNGEQTPEGVADCVCWKSYCRNLLREIANEIMAEER